MALSIKEQLDELEETIGAIASEPDVPLDAIDWREVALSQIALGQQAQAELEGLRDMLSEGRE